MKGFMRRRGDAWELRVYLGTDPVTGKQRYATRTVRGGKREAQRVLNEMVTDADRGLSVRTNATAGELIEAWFEHAAGDFSPKTVKETRGFIDRNLLPAIGDVPLSKLKASDLDRLYRRLQATGAVGERRAGAGHRAPHPRHPPSSARPGGQVGMARRQPGRGHDTTARPAVRDRATVRSRPRSGPSTGVGVLAGAGVLPRAGGGDRCATVRAGGAALARPRPLGRHRPDRAWRRHGSRPGSSRRTRRPTPPDESPSTVGRSTSSRAHRARMARAGGDVSRRAHR